MATLTPLKTSGLGAIITGTWYRYDRGASAWTQGASQTAPQLAALVDETITSSAASGDTAIGLAPAVNASNQQLALQLTSVNSDFGNMDTIGVRVSAVNFGPYSDDTGQMKIYVAAASGTILAQPANQTWFYSGTAWSSAGGNLGTPAYNQSQSWTLTAAGLAANKATWDDALVEITSTDVRNMGADNAAILIVDLEITGTYTASGGGPSNTAATKVSGSFTEKPTNVKISGTFQSKPLKVKVGGSWF